MDFCFQSTANSKEGEYNDEYNDNGVVVEQAIRIVGYTGSLIPLSCLYYAIFHLNSLWFNSLY